MRQMNTLTILRPTHSLGLGEQNGATRGSALAQGRKFTSIENHQLTDDRGRSSKAEVYFSSVDVGLPGILATVNTT